MAQYLKNHDKILQAVLNDSKLIELGKYNPEDYPTLDDAFESDNAIVQTVAKLIGGTIQDLPEKTIYNQINDYLKLKV